MTEICRGQQKGAAAAPRRRASWCEPGRNRQKLRADLKGPPLSGGAPTAGRRCRRHKLLSYRGLESRVPVQRRLTHNGRKQVARKEALIIPQDGQVECRDPPVSREDDSHIKASPKSVVDRSRVHTNHITQVNLKP